MTLHTKTKINAAVCATVLLAVAGWYISDRRDISAQIADVKDAHTEDTLSAEKRLTTLELQFDSIDARLEKIEKNTEAIRAAMYTKDYNNDVDWANRPAE